MLKAGSLAVTVCLGLLLLTPPALASSLLTGSVRDLHGAPVTGASVAGLDANGSSLGAATTDTDGTFALSTAVEPAFVRIECAYCRPQTIRVRAEEPVVAIVQRYDALLADGPTSADMAALPYVQIENALALRPFEVRHLQFLANAALGPAVSDRGLATSALVLDGEASTYFLGGAGNGLSTVPTHAGDVPVFVAASQAYQYGGYATGGIIQLTRDPMLIEQAGYGDSSFLRLTAGTANAGVSLGSEANDLTHRERVIATGALPFLGGTLAGQVTAARATTFSGSETFDLSEQSATVDFARSFRRILLRASAAATFGSQNFFASSSNFWTDFTARASASSSVGAFDLEAGSVYTNATNYFPEFSANTYPQATVYVKTHVAGRTSFDAGVANTGFRSANGEPGRQATLPSLVVTQSLGSFSVVAGYSQSLFAVSGIYGGVAASLAEAHLDYGDGKRLRAELQTYRQVHDRELQPLSGTGVSVLYQLTPTTSIRAWSLRLFGDEPLYSADAYVSGDTVWVTNQNGGFRIDAIYHRMAGRSIFRRTLDGDVYFPIATRASIGFRSELRPQGRRSSLVLSLQP